MKLLLAFLALIFAPAALAQETPAVSPLEASGVEPENILNLDLSTGGRVVIVMRPDIAPNHVERIRTLTRQGFYDGVIFHRVIPGFMAQTGDPTGTGTGASELPDLAPEFTRTPHLRGTVSMARADAENSANSQFFITFMPTPQVDEEYTVWGRVASGMEFVDRIAPGEPPAIPSRILKASIEADRVPPPDFAAIAARQESELLKLPSGPIGLPGTPVTGAGEETAAAPAADAAPAPASSENISGEPVSEQPSEEQPRDEATGADASDIP